MMYVNCTVLCALFKRFKALYCFKNNRFDTLTSFRRWGCFRRRIVAKIVFNIILTHDVLQKYTHALHFTI